MNEKQPNSTRAEQMIFRRRQKEDVPQQPWSHIVIIDGTLSQLSEGKRTHCGRLFGLLREDHTQRQHVYYDPGVQGKGWQKWLHVASGRGLNRSIINSYQQLSERYREGDKIFLFGYSRGAYAARILAGMINTLGLLKPQYATRKFAREAYLLYAERQKNEVLRAFKKHKCRSNIPIDFLGVWDTVKALGLPIPFIGRYAPLVVDFKDYKVPRAVKVARHALAANEQRRTYRPETWRSRAPETELVQMIFPGSHAIVGGQFFHLPEASELSNLSMNWMLGEAAGQGLELPSDWQTRFTESTTYIEDKIDDYWYWPKEERKFLPAELFTKHASLEQKSS